MRDDDENDDDDDDDDDGYPAYSHQSESHQVGIRHNDEGWVGGGWSNSHRTHI